MISDQKWWKRKTFPEPTSAGLLTACPNSTPIGGPVIVAYVRVLVHSFASNADTGVANWSTEWVYTNAQ